MHFKHCQSFLEEPFRQPLPHEHTALQASHHSSLEESPIPNRFREESDHSPDQYLYPESLQVKNNKLYRVYDLKQKMLCLLERLKEWLQELCLTEVGIGEVSEQLQPIIHQMREVSDAEDSCWFSCLPRHQRGPRHSLLRDSHSLYDRSAEGPNQSILIHQSRERAQVWLLSEGEKNLVRLFFKKYCRLLENSLYRINKYSGEKKLKFLLETNIRNIFSETLRVSYDLRLIDFRLKEQRTLRLRNNSTVFTQLLAGRIAMFLSSKGHIRNAFATLKAAYLEEGKRDHQMVTQMIAKIGKMCHLYDKNRLLQLQSFTYKWRASAFQLKTQEEICLVDCVRSKVAQLLDGMVDLGESAAEFMCHWRTLLASNLNAICCELFPEEDCFFLNLEDILNERYSKVDQLFTLAQYITQTYPDEDLTARSSFRDLTVQELRACILSGQIHRSEKMEGSLLLVPIKAAAGIFFVRLDSGTARSGEKPPMRLSSFRSLLRIVELMTPMVEDLTAVCKRLQSSWEEGEKTQHYSFLLQQFLKVDLVQEQGHMQLECKPSEIAIDSNRLQSSSQTAKAILQSCQIQSLMIYHCSKGGAINEVPCIMYGDNEVALTQRHIIHSIFQELLTSGKELLTINRNGQLFNILPLRSNHSTVGLINFICSSERIDREMLSQCLVPLLLKSEGKINCEHCKVSLKLPPQEDLQQESNHNHSNQTPPSFQILTKLAASSSLQEIEDECSSMLRDRGNFFFRMVYKINLGESSTYYSVRQDELITHQLDEDEKIAHKEMFIEDYLSMTNCSTFARIAFESPCFPNPQLHIYQNEKSFPFRLVAIPIKNTNHHYGYFLAAFYHADTKTSDQNISFLFTIAETIGLNSIVFKTTNINDSRLKIHLPIEQKDQQLVSKTVKDKVKWTVNDKFAHNLLETLNLLRQQIREINHNKYQFNVSLLKANIKTRRLRVLASTSAKTCEIKMGEELACLLQQKNLVMTHEQMASGDCKLKKAGFNRTVRPTKAQQLNNLALFLPALSAKGDLQILEIIRNKYKLKGVYANEYLQVMQEMDTQLSKQSFRPNQMYSVVTFGSSSSSHSKYIAFLQHDMIEPQHINVFSQQTVSECSSIFSQILQQSAAHQPSTLQKRSKIMLLHQIITHHYTIRHSIQKFKQQWASQISKANRMFTVLIKYFLDPNHKNELYFKELNKGFSKLKKKNSYDRRNSYIFIQKISGIIGRLQKESSKKAGFDHIYKFVQVNFRFSQTRSVRRLKDLLQTNLLSIHQCVFNQIRHMSSIRSHNKSISLRQLALKVDMITSKIKKREIYGYFFSQINKIHNQYINSFDLIVEQFHNLQLHSKQQLITFANQRLHTIVSQLSYGVVLKIQIGLAQLSANKHKLTINLLNNDKEISEKVIERPISFEPQSHNNFNFLPINTPSNNHFLLYRVDVKNELKMQKQMMIIRNSILKGIVPCCSRYFQGLLTKGEKLCQTLLNITCKELWNGTIEETQNIYAFGKGINYEQQSDKVRAFAAIKNHKKSQQIKQLKKIRCAINEEVKQYYRLEYQYNSIANAIAFGIPDQTNKEDLQIFNRYEEFISKDQLRAQREATEKMEIEYERKSLQYQIKSKTFATSKILMFCDRKEKEDIEKTGLSLLTNCPKENINSESANLQKAIVQGKIQLSSNIERVKKVRKSEKMMAVKSMCLSLTGIWKNRVERATKEAFKTFCCPASSKLRA